MLNPQIKPERQTPVVPIWIALLEIPWHFYYTDILTPMLSPIGEALYIDTATML